MVTSYCCSWSSILWSLGGALARLFWCIISSGLWSNSTVNGLLRTYMLNLWQANTMAKSSLSMFVYLVLCLWGSYWQRWSFGLPVVDKHSVLFGRHWPVPPQISFYHSIWAAGNLFWHLSPWSSENCHLPFDPSGRLCPASALPLVALCDERDVVQSSPCMSPFQWNWPAIACL